MNQTDQHTSRNVDARASIWLTAISWVLWTIGAAVAVLVWLEREATRYDMSELSSLMGFTMFGGGFALVAGAIQFLYGLATFSTNSRFWAIFDLLNGALLYFAFVALLEFLYPG